jgi:GT2 family glycosyltransferase
MTLDLDKLTETLSVSVIICAYTEQRWDDLVKALASVRQQTKPPEEIIVVIDHCPALLRRAAQELAGVQVVPNRNQQGLSGARNTGLQVASGEVVAFLDDDAAAATDWIARLLAGYADPRVAGVGGRARPNWREGRPAWFPTEFDWVVGCSYRGLPTTRGPVRNFIGANMSFRRDLLRALDGFHTALGRVGSRPLGCEETELCIRMQRRHPDCLLLYEPAAQVWHSVPAARGRWSYFRSRCYAEGLSKAAVSRLAGANQALSSERSYLSHTITRGITRCLVHVLRGRMWGIVMALVMVAGVTMTVLGYAVGRAQALSGPPGRDIQQDVSVRSRLAGAATRAALPAALVLWLISLPQIDLHRMGDFGLVPLLPVTFWLALVVLLVGYCALLRRPGTPTPLLVAHILTLIAILHATPTLLYGSSLRYSWTWKHVGVVDFFIRHAGVDPRVLELNAYQYWPGFFTLNAMLAKASGLASPLGYAAWGPPFNNALLIGPLFLIFGTFTADRRLIWSAMGIFFLGSWVGQDYFSPQACDYFLYLTVIALCLRYLKPKVRPRVRGGGLPATADTTVASSAPAEQAELGTRDRRLLITLGLVPIMAAIVPTHQLTPIMLISGLVVLTVVCRQRVAVLALLMIGFTLGWDLIFARPFITQNLYWIQASLGTVGANANSGFINLAGASKGQVIVAQIDRIHSVTVMALATIGFCRRFRSLRELALPLLAVAPMPLILANDYGGEMIFRLYLFGLPFAAFYAGACFFPGERSGRSRWTRLALPTVVVLLVPGFAFSYYGKEQDNYFSPQELAASRFVYGVAPRGSVLVAATSDFPWAFVDYEFYDYQRFALEDPKERQAVVNDPVGTFEKIMDPQRHHHAYLLLTRSQIADVEMTGIMPQGSIVRIEQTLTHSPEFTVIYRNPDAVVITLTQPTPKGVP